MNVRSRRTPTLKRRNRKRYVINAKRLALSLLFLALVAEVASVAFTSPWFHVRKRVVVGNETIPSSKILADLRIPPDANIFLIRKSALARRIEASPVIKAVSLDRKLPDTLIVRVVERRPDLVLAAPEGSYEVDSAAVPFRKASKASTKLPVISCGVRQKVIFGKPLTDPCFILARKCLLLARQKGLAGIGKITVDQNGDLCLNVVDGYEVRLGRPERLSRKLDVAIRTAERYPNFRERGEYIIVTSPEAAAVKLKD